MKRSPAGAIVAAVAGIALLLATATVAEGFVYFDSVTENPHSSIGRANLDGTGVNLAFVTGADDPCGIDVDGAYVYWANNFNGTGSNTIGRAGLEGEAVDQSFIQGASSPCGVAVNGTHIYWANTSGPVECPSLCTTIGRANLDGSGVDQSFIAGLGQATGVAVDGAHVYWTDRGGTIGRADLDGTNVNPAFVAGLTEPRGLAVNGSHLYWGSWTSPTVGRANLDGSGVDASLITIPPADSATVTPCAIAVDGTHVYWSYFSNQLPIGRASLDGTNVEGFIAPSGGCGVAVDARQPSSTSITSAATGSAPFGEVLSFTAKVSSANPSGNPATPTGTIQFAVDGSDEGPAVGLDANGEAHLDTFVDVAGTVTARYSGSPSFGSSRAELSPDVRPAATATALTASSNPATEDDEVTFVATVSNTETDFVPFGSVLFLIDGEVVIEPQPLDETGQTGIVVGGFDPGDYEVYALYYDDTATIPDFLESEAALTQRIVERSPAPPPPPAPPVSPPPPPSPPPAVKPLPPSPANNAFTLLRPTAASTGRIRLRMRAAGPGTFRVTATRCSPARSRCPAASPAYGTARATTRAGGSVTLAVAPNAGTRSALARGRTMRVTVSVRFRSAKGGAVRTRRASLLVKGRRTARR